ncbi:hypothetical protein KAFR_0A00100 [Kazachstania africana CBS 2517]|uniref:Uncharacterized protein n=1 Tax=Kazachstania africana (strain ATCC 22294 / BCRC 22015 / CBS 2517 / CECT 1963 / NBRC 1671 / NRRL Y-8276) TaxID=1071382 RepID=H2AM48_KAZAF|nr:hypothetical protein KAFR_0A00100 [Kazachstania africana CBS 2517]CCF55448.1 hypothetical protein KAFR_0A00100 [Kazachstania africana CBS 2517]
MMAWDIYDRYASFYSLTNTTQHMYPALGVVGTAARLAPTNCIYDDVVSMFTTAGLGVPVIAVRNVTELERRDVGNSTYTIHWATELGKHSATHLEHYDPIDMANDIISQYKTGYNGTSKYFKANNYTLEKRTDRYTVDWVSYNVDNENASLETVAWESTRDPGDWEEDIANALFTNDLDTTWKWCITVMASGSDSYDSFGTEDATHGEAYTNQYGGIDSYCNDNKGGAQCSTDGCQ